MLHSLVDSAEGSSMRQKKHPKYNITDENQ